MLAYELLHPKSIAVVGASDDYAKPEGERSKICERAILRENLTNNNPKAAVDIQGLPTVADVASLPQVDLAVLAILACVLSSCCRDAGQRQRARGIIIFLQASLSWELRARRWSGRWLSLVKQYGATIIGPNCIGMMNGKFTVLSLPNHYQP